MDLIFALLAIAFLHSLSRRLTLRIASERKDLLFTDAWVLYAIVFTSGLVIGFHLLGFIALASGAGVIHSGTLAAVLAGPWGIDRLVFGSLTAKADFPSIRSVLTGIRQELGQLHPLMLGSLLIAGAIFLLFLIEAATRPPEGWDGMVYHLPLAAKWFQQASLAFLWESWKFQMPSNGELISLLVRYLGSERVVTLAYVPFTLLAMLVIRNLAYRLSGSPECAVLAMLGFGTLPIVLYNTFNIEVDMFAASFCLASLYILVLLFLDNNQTAEGRMALAGVAGLAFGLGLGARYVYVPLYLFLSGLCLAVLVVKRSPFRLVFHQRAIAATLFFVIAALLPSAFWYVRNFVATGNAMHPLQFAVGSHGISVSIRKLAERPAELAPPVNRDSSCLTAGDRDLHDWMAAPWEDCWYAGGDHFSENWGLGPVFATFIPTLALGAIAITFAMSLRRREFHPVVLLSLIVAVLLVYWWFFLYTLARSVFPVMGILFVCAAYAVSLCSARSRRLVYALFLLAMLFNGVLVAAKPLQSLTSRVHHQIWTRSSYYEIPEAIEHLPPASVILNASDERKNYPLFGGAWQNRAVTDRALLEPTITRTIDEDFIKRWGIEYVLYDSRQKWAVNPSIIREVIVRHDVGEDGDQYEQLLYRVGVQ